MNRLHHVKAFSAILMTLCLFGFASAATVGHSAPAISAGTFESGNFAFPNNLTVGGTNLFVNNATGYIGIGTLDPSQRLDIFGNLRVQGYGNFSGTVYVNNGTDILTYIGSNVSGSSYWNLSGSNLFLKDLGYNIGIGTTTPSQKLDVRGNGNFSGTVYLNNNTDILEYVNSVTAGNASSGSTFNATYDAFWMSNSTIWAAINSGSTNTNSSSTYVPYVGANSNINLNGLNITNISMMGIGISSPQARLHVQGDVILNASATGGNVIIQLLTAPMVTGRWR